MAAAETAPTPTDAAHADTDAFEGQFQAALAAARGDSRDELIRLLDETPLLLSAHDSSGQTICKAASESGASACLRLCIKKGCNINDNPVGSKTALMAGAMAARFACLTTLLQHGADPNIVLPETGATALILASKVGAAMCVEELLRAGAEANAVDLRGNSSLHAAAALGSKGKTAVHHLLAHGADPELGNDDGVTPMAVARDAGFADIAEDMAQFEHVEEVLRIRAAAAEAKASASEAAAVVV